MLLNVPALRIHMSEKSAFRPCGRDLVEFFNSTGWAFFVQVDYFRVARQPGVSAMDSHKLTCQRQTPLSPLAPSP
jgi:hypothetical protein